MTTPRIAMRTLWAMMLGALILTATGCGESSTSSSSTTTDADTILIGSFLSLTGPTATFGTTTREGIELAVKHRNEAGGVMGKQVAVKFMDNQGKTQETGTAVTRLITHDHVVALLGDVASTQSLAAAPVAQQYGVPMVSPSSTNPQVTEVGDMIFRACVIDPAQGYVVARFAYDRGIRRVAVLFDQKQAYSAGLKDHFTEWFTKLGGEVATVQTYASGDSDFSAQLNTIKAAQAEAIFVPGYYTEVGTLAIQARRLGITAPLMGGDGWESPKLAEIGGEAIEGCFYSNHYAPEDDRPESKAYIEAYQKEYGRTSGALAALGYDAAMLLFDAMERAQSLDGRKLADAIAATTDFQGVTGTINIDAHRNAQKPMVILEIKNGQPVYVTTIDPPQ